MESLDRRGVGHRWEVEPGSIRMLLSSAVNAYYLRERFWPLEANMDTEERGVEDSRSAKTTGVYRVFFSVTLGTHEDTIQPVQIDEPRYKILRTSQCSLHAPIFEGQADKIRRDGQAPGHRKALHRKKSEAQNPTSSCRPAD